MKRGANGTKPMREIKFKALVEYEGLGKVWEYYKTFTQPMWLDPIVAKIIVKDLQFTGLKDKNGNDIYEEDIILAHETSANYPLKYIVVYNEEETAFRLRWEEHYKTGFYDKKISESRYKTFEVIGNIYENSTTKQ